MADTWLELLREQCERLPLDSCELLMGFPYEILAKGLVATAVTALIVIALPIYQHFKSAVSQKPRAKSEEQFKEIDKKISEIFRLRLVFFLSVLLPPFVMTIGHALFTDEGISWFMACQIGASWNLIIKSFGKK